MHISFLSFLGSKSTTILGCNASIQCEANLKQESNDPPPLPKLKHFNFKQDGFFVEAGALNGVDNSNTYILEKKYGYRLR